MSLENDLDNLGNESVVASQEIRSLSINIDLDSENKTN